MTSTRTCLVVSLLLTGCGLSATPQRSADAPAAEVARVPAPSVESPKVVAAAKAEAPAKEEPPAKAATPPKADAPVKATLPPKVVTAPSVPTPPRAATAPSAATPPKAAPVAVRPTTPPLDLKSLEQRLKETSAVGLLTKLSLKNQVDDLIARFRAFHGGQRPPTLGELRPSYDLLLMKVLSLLQDKDAALAKDIDASRNAIWEVLADRDKLAQST